MNKLFSNNEFQNDNGGYIPGICNLGKKEINKRKVQSIAGLALTILCIITLQFFHFEPVWRLIVFAPLFYSIICFLQAREKFCVVFGIYGVYNFTDERNVVAVEEEEYHTKDRKKAFKIFFTSLAIAIVIVVIYFYLPV